MKIYNEISLTNFEFWNGAKDTKNFLTDEDLKQIEFTLEDVFPDGMDAMTLNDLFWFDRDFIAEILGYEDFEQLMNEHT